jgi:hypothetical protein
LILFIDYRTLCNQLSFVAQAQNEQQLLEVSLAIESTVFCVCAAAESVTEDDEELIPKFIDILPNLPRNGRVQATSLRLICSGLLLQMFLPLDLISDIFT